jgi:hypothetical protein
MCIRKHRPDTSGHDSHLTDGEVTDNLIVVKLNFARFQIIHLADQFDLFLVHHLAQNRTASRFSFITSHTLASDTPAHERSVSGRARLNVTNSRLLQFFLNIGEQLYQPMAKSRVI